MLVFVHTLIDLKLYTRLPDGLTYPLTSVIVWVMKPVENLKWMLTMNLSNQILPLNFSECF